MHVFHTVFYTIVGLYILLAYISELMAHISELMAHISELISVRDTRRYDLCSNDSLLLAGVKPPLTLGEQSFDAAAPKFWNNLPGSIRNTQSLNKLKKVTKTFICESFLILFI